MALETYRKRRHFNRTQEPSGTVGAENGFSFVVQKHAASHLHYDFRLELNGVLLSWAVPKGPSLDPKVKRLAMQTEDHPIAYAGFEGIIPKGEYGGGTVMVWDQGRYIPEGDIDAGYKKGHLKFRLEGRKLRGLWHLVRTRGQDGDAKNRKDGKETKKSWLLFKGSDEEANSARNITDDQPKSVLSGRDLDQIARSADKVWASNRTATEAANPATIAMPTIAKGKIHASGQPKIQAYGVAELTGAKKLSMPGAIEPQLATLTKVAPGGDEWLHEIKFDGYRLLARLDHGKVTLLTRHALDWTHRFAGLAQSLASLNVEQAILDGEVVVLDERGISNFQALQNFLQAPLRKGSDLTYFAFDLLYLDGWDLREVRLDSRKEILRSLVADGTADVPVLRFSDHVSGKGEDARTGACKLGLEGIVSKRRDAAYRSGRSGLWLKAKCAARQEFVLGGYSDPGGSREHFGAVLLGVYQDGQLRYAGKSGSGFTEASLRELHAKLTRLEQRHPPFVNPPRGAEARGVHWLKPELVAEISFAGFTGDGHARQAIFQGLREDKPAVEVKRESEPAPKNQTNGHSKQRTMESKAAKALPGAASYPAPSSQITHPDRILYPDQGLTKQSLVDYYLQVAPLMLPHVEGRPLTLVRCPQGQEQNCFYQKHAQPGLPKALVPVPIRENGKDTTYVSIRDADGLVALVQMGVLEIHIWGSRSDQPEVPDRLVFDLDPDTDIAWTDVVTTAQELRERLERLALRSFVKNTGGKGLHVIVPIKRDGRRFGWDKAKSFCKSLAQAMAADSPTRYLATASKAKRKGKIYLDYLRNGRGATSIAAYSTRARSGAPVATPLDWDELLATGSSTAYSVQSLPQRLQIHPEDPWRDLTTVNQSLDPALLKKL